ncbi:MAG: hypothetical protein ABIE74_07540 [Pseudomonadota bacterium]
MRKTLTLFFASLLALVVLQDSAFAVEDCKNVNIMVHNKSSSTIEVKNLKVYDANDRKWRVENVENKAIAAGGTQSWNQNLANVGMAQIKLMTYYVNKLPKSDKWSSEKTHTTGSSFTCKDGMTIHIKISK